MATEDGFPEATFLRLLPRIDRQCRFIAARHGLFAAEAEDFTSHVRLRLIEDDYAILRKFQGRARIETFLATVIENLGRDYKISLTQKWRPTAEARRLGATAVLLERLLFRDGYSLEQAWEIMTTNHRLSVSRGELEALVAQLPPRAVRQFVSVDALESVSTCSRGPDDLAIENEGRATVVRVRAALADVKATLPPRDQLILAMRYEDGAKIVDIGRTLGIEQRVLYRHVDTIHARIRHALASRGIGTDVLAWFEAHT